MEMPPYHDDHPDWAMQQGAPTQEAADLAERLLDVMVPELAQATRSDALAAILHATMRVLAGCTDDDTAIERIFAVAGGFFTELSQSVCPIPEDDQEP